MDSDSLELLSKTHETFAQHAGGNYYDELRSRLDNRMGGVALEGVHEGERAAQNFEFLRKAVNVFPAVKQFGVPPHKNYNSDNPHRVNFVLDNQADVRWVQNTVLWVKPSPAMTYSPSRMLRPCPMYVIGENVQGRRASLMLHDPAAVNRDARSLHPLAPIYIATMHKLKYREMREMTKENLYHPLSVDEVEKRLIQRVVRIASVAIIKLNHLKCRHKLRIHLEGPYLRVCQE